MHEMKIETFTEQQATDEAILLLTRKLHRLYPDANADLMAKLPDGARNALTLADNRADLLRAYDQRDGIARFFADEPEEEES